MALTTTPPPPLIIYSTPTLGEKRKCIDYNYHNLSLDKVPLPPSVKRTSISLQLQHDCLEHFSSFSFPSLQTASSTSSDDDDGDDDDVVRLRLLPQISTTSSSALNAFQNAFARMQQKHSNKNTTDTDTSRQASDKTSLSTCSLSAVALPEEPVKPLIRKQQEEEQQEEQEYNSKSTRGRSPMPKLLTTTTATTLSPEQKQALLIRRCQQLALSPKNRQQQRRFNRTTWSKSPVRVSNDNTTRTIRRAQSGGGLLRC